MDRRNGPRSGSIGIHERREDDAWFHQVNPKCSHRGGVRWKDIRIPLKRVRVVKLHQKQNKRRDKEKKIKTKTSAPTKQQYTGSGSTYSTGGWKGGGGERKVRQGWSEISRGFLGAHWVMEVGLRQSFGHGANRLAQERFPLTWYNHTFVHLSTAVSFTFSYFFNLIFLQYTCCFWALPCLRCIVTHLYTQTESVSVLPSHISCKSLLSSDFSPPVAWNVRKLEI